MIKLKTELRTLRRLYEDYRNLDGWEKETHSALVAHAYQEALSSGAGKSFASAKQFAAWINARVFELLKSWGVEP